jgi:hypothetical protein
MTQVRITYVIGEPPISVYVSDIYGNNKSLIGVITGGTANPVPPVVYQNPPTIFNGSPSILLTMEDTYGNEKSKILSGTYGCTFNVIFEMVGCTSEFIINTI